MLNSLIKNSLISVKMQKEWNDSLHMMKIIFVFIFLAVFTILIFLKITSARIFSNFEFHTQKFRFLKYISIIDALFLSTVFLLPFIEIQSLLDDWFMYSHVLVSYELYINTFFNKGLLTLNSLINLKISWNQYREFENYNVTSQWFRTTILISALFSFLLYFPNLLLYKISKEENSTAVYTIEISQIDYFKYYTPFQHVISFTILIMIVLINLILFIKIKKLNKSKFKSIIFTANSKAYNTVLGKEKKNCLIQQKIVLKSLSSTATTTSAVSTRRNSKLIDTKITSRLLWVSFVILADEFIRTCYELSKLFVRQNTKTSTIILIFYIIILAFTQLSPIIIFYKTHNSFAERLRQIFRKYVLLNLNSA